MKMTNNASQTQLEEALQHDIIIPWMEDATTTISTIIITTTPV